MTKFTHALYAIGLCVLIACGVQCFLFVHHIDQDRAWARTVAEQDHAELKAKAIVELDEIHRATLEIALTAMEARKVSAMEQKALPQITENVEIATAKLSTAVDGLGTVTKATATTIATIGEDTHSVLMSTDDAITALAPVEHQATMAIAEVKVDATDLHNILDSPDTKGMLAHGNHATGQVDAAITDTAEYWHKTLHPSWPKRIYSAITSTGISVARLIW